MKRVLLAVAAASALLIAGAASAHDGYDRDYGRHHRFEAPLYGYGYGAGYGYGYGDRYRRERHYGYDRRDGDRGHDGWRR